MNSDEIRTAFLEFFAAHGHRIMPSSALVPHGDPTLLLTTAGMVQFKPYFLGELAPPHPRLTSCQKCFRTTDIESVGDSRHLTFFEMLGNFSIGDYFKREAIHFAWEFVTDRLKLPPERLWVTVFRDDDEAFGIWRDEIGVPEARIVRCGEKDNFWGPAGATGPCGPCSELHYDFGEAVGCREATCNPSCGCGRFSEIWNLVFMQYNQDAAKCLTPLPRPNIDTGMGLERVTAIIEGKKSVYETDLFTSLLAKVAELTGQRYGDDETMDNAIRIVAEHSRGITFLIADGVIPSNEWRGYVLRRLVRRAALHGRKLGLEKPFLTEMAQAVIGKMAHVYPELTARRDFILRVIELEEARFGETLSAGLQIIENIVAAGAGQTKVISGADAFRLYDTYGFPVEITREVAESRGLVVDIPGFEREMAQQREKARAAAKFAVAQKEAPPLETEVQETPFVGYYSLQEKTAVIGLVVDGKQVDSVAAGQAASVILETTPFYGEMGGQVGDTGEIRGSRGKFEVTNTTHLTPDVILHHGKVSEGVLRVGDEVEAEVDGGRRQDIARNHTATHLLQYALRQTLGGHVEQRGSLVTPERLRFDFAHLEPLKPEELARVNSTVNELVRANLPVYGEEMPYERATKEGAIALFGEKYGDRVRVLRVGKPPVSAEFCGGTHVSATGEIGYFTIISEGSVGAGLRRIEALTGRGADEFITHRFAEWQKVAQNVGASADNLSEKVASTASALDAERKRVQVLESQLARSKAEELLARVEIVSGVKVLTARVDSFAPEVLREMSDFLRDKLGSAIVVLGTVYQERPAFLAAVTPDLVAKGYNAGDIVRQVAKVTGGGGGGKPNLAQAGGKDKSRVDEALRLVKGLIKA